MPLDLGLCTLFASDKGDLCGRKLFEVLKKYDGLISSLAANRQRQGLKTRSPKYAGLADNRREYLKNEINRVLNRIVKMYSPAELVVERLDFRSPDLSRRMNEAVNASVGRLRAYYRTPRIIGGIRHSSKGFCRERCRVAKSGYFYVLL